MKPELWWFFLGGLVIVWLLLSVELLDQSFFFALFITMLAWIQNKSSVYSSETSFHHVLAWAVCKTSAILPRSLFGSSLVASGGDQSCVTAILVFTTRKCFGEHRYWCSFLPPSLFFSLFLPPSFPFFLPSSFSSFLSLVLLSFLPVFLCPFLFLACQKTKTSSLSHFTSYSSSS